MQLFGLGPLEWIVVLVIVLLLFGSTRLPALARALGESIREFRKASSTSVESKPSSDPLLETARKLGISTEGKSRKQIADDIAKKSEEST